MQIKLPDGANADVCSYTGEVLELKSDSHVHVNSISVGGNTHISSKTDKSTSIWLRDSSGNERRFQIDGDLPCAARASHKLTFVWLVAEGTEKGHVLAVYSHNDKKAYWLRQSNDEFLVLLKQMGGVYECREFLYWALFLSGVGIPVMIGMWLYFEFKADKLQKRLQPLVLQAATAVGTDAGARAEPARGAA